MKILIKYPSFLVILVVLIFVGCENKKDTEPNPPTDDQLIIENWSIEKITLGGQELTSTSYSIKFNAGNTFDFNTPGVPGLAQKGNWVYQQSSKTIRLNGDTDLVVDKITEANFSFTYTYKNHKMGAVEVKFTLKK